jgi:thioredoxin-dependent peroxiredoxin
VKSLALLLLSMTWLVAAPSLAELKAGDIAPDFALSATDGKTYKLSDFRGKQSVVLAWFPKAYTYGCTIECKSLAQNGHLIKRYQATYFMASTDPLETNRGFAAQAKADFPLLSDPTRKTAKAYGVVAGDADYANRWTFYIGSDGKISYIDKNVNPAKSAEDMAAMLEKLGTPKK